MIIHAYRKADELVNSIKNLDTEDLEYLGIINYVEEIAPEYFIDGYENKYAVIDNSGKLIGYIEYEDSGCNWKMCSFDRSNIIFVIDCYKLFVKVLKDKESITFSVHKNNPINTNKRLHRMIATKLGGWRGYRDNDDFHTYTIKSRRLIGLKDMVDEMMKPFNITISNSLYYKHYNEFVFCAKVCDSDVPIPRFMMEARIERKLRKCEYISTVTYLDISSDGIIEFHFTINDNFYDSYYYTDVVHNCGISLDGRGFVIYYSGDVIDYDKLDDGTYKRAKNSIGYYYHGLSAFSRYNLGEALEQFNHVFELRRSNDEYCYFDLHECIMNDEAFYRKDICNKYTFDPTKIKDN